MTTKTEKEIAKKAKNYINIILRKSLGQTYSSIEEEELSMSFQTEEEVDIFNNYRLKNELVKYAISCLGQYIYLCVEHITQIKSHIRLLDNHNKMQILLNGFLEKLNEDKTKKKVIKYFVENQDMSSVKIQYNDNKLIFNTNYKRDDDDTLEEYILNYIEKVNKSFVSYINLEKVIIDYIKKEINIEAYHYILSIQVDVKKDYQELHQYNYIFKGLDSLLKYDDVIQKNDEVYNQLYLSYFPITNSMS